MWLSKSLFAYMAVAGCVFDKSYDLLEFGSVLSIETHR